MDDGADLRAQGAAAIDKGVLLPRGAKVRFADAYLVDSPEELSARRFKSVTTVMALSAPETISTSADLMAFACATSFSIATSPMPTVSLCSMTLILTISPPKVMTITRTAPPMPSSEEPT